MRESKRPTARGGFTLIELLVVVSIIALMIALLLPALASARQAGYAANCLSNLRQQGIGFASYANEHHDYMPGLNGWWDRLAQRGYFGGGERWGPYINNFGYSTIRYRVFECKAEVPLVATASLADTNYNGRAFRNFDDELGPTSYMYNFSISWYNGIYYATPRKGFSSPKNVHPSAAPIVMDARHWGWGWVLAYYEWNVDAAPDYATYYSHGFRHTSPGGASNTLYLDSHAAPRRHYVDTGSPNWIPIWSDEPAM